MVAAMETPETDSVDGTGASAAPEAGERIAKRLARAGLCSRRDAERWIAEGRVEVNGRTLDSPACVVRPGDTVVVDGKPVPEPEPARLWRYHKPSGLVTTARDEKGRDTVFSALPSDMPRVVSVGRLDLTTEGLLLLTNDGELARFLELPATGWTRRYRVRVHGMVNEKQLANLSKGLTIDGIHYGPIEAVLDRVQGANAWLTVGIKEGKNREIRKVMETLGLVVTRLIRIAYGPFQLGKLDEGAVEEVPKRVMKDQLARFFAAQGGEDAEPARTASSKSPSGKAGAVKAATPKPPRRPAAPKAAASRAEAPAPKGRPARGERSGSDRFGEERSAGGRFSGEERPAPGPRKGPARPASSAAAAPAGKPARSGPAKSAPPTSAPAGRADARTEAPRSQGNRASFSERLRLERPEGGKPGGRPPRRDGGDQGGRPGGGSPNGGPRRGGGRADRRR